MWWDSLILISISSSLVWIRLLPHNLCASSIFSLDICRNNQKSWQNNWPSLLLNSSMDLFSFVNLLAISPRTSESKSRYKIVSGCSNSSWTPLTSWSAPFPRIPSNASIKQENWAINLSEVSPCDNHLVAPACCSILFPKAACALPKKPFSIVTYFIIFQQGSNTLSTSCNTVKWTNTSVNLWLQQFTHFAWGILCWTFLASHYIPHSLYLFHPCC